MNRPADPTWSSPTPPGWYWDGATHRWWDGSQWGPPAPPPPQRGTTLAVFAHLGILVGGFVLPLVLRATADEDDAYLRHHATEALNFQITLSLVWAVLMFPAFLFFVASAGSGSGAALGIWFGAIGCGMLLGVGALVSCIVGAVRANKGIWYRYPVSIRFVRGAAPRGTEPLPSDGRSTPG